MDRNSPEYQFNKMQEEMLKQQPIPGMQQKQTDQSIKEQRVLAQVQSGAPPAPAVASQDECRQCGLIHPPLSPGQKCPNAPLEVEGKPEFNVNELVVKVKDILASQLEQKDIKDFDKFTGEMVIALMKFCEEYKE